MLTFRRFITNCIEKFRTFNQIITTQYYIILTVIIVTFHLIILTLDHNYDLSHNFRISHDFITDYKHFKCMQ